MTHSEYREVCLLSKGTEGNKVNGRNIKLGSRWVEDIWGRNACSDWLVRQLFVLVSLERCPRVTIGWAPVYVHCKRSSLTDSENGAFGAGDTFRVVVRSQPQTNDYGVQWSTGRHDLVKGRPTRSPGREVSWTRVLLRGTDPSPVRLL